jgi:AraC-like DNA-binding protein
LAALELCLRSASVALLLVLAASLVSDFRKVLAGRLAYRNFNVFLNNHRIEEAKAALADPSQAEVPVITIAMDAGFQSLGPFNRAFKATTGVTPTEYRKLKANAV